MTVGRIPSVEGGIQPTIFDAKADLLTATAADTPARLAVGANNTVLTADSSTATGLKWATPAGGGKVLQVVTATYGTDTDTSSTSYVDTGLTATITPTLSTSKVFVLVTFTGQIRKAAADNNGTGQFQVLRGATSIITGGCNVACTTALNSFDVRNTQTLSNLDSPATTSATTYKLQYKTTLSTATFFMLNASGGSGGVAQITLFEIGA
jgi:hypothetical protein